ncbi:MAG TPA: DNA polymerase III subunit delta', partial [Sulfurimonas autotrophica]|nr:DNA polymerase III subunit delta' [Sulfurimonas autotrophica]
MQDHNLPLQGHIRIASSLESAVETLEDILMGFRVVKFLEENFKIEHAKLVTAEAYIS